MNNITQVLIFLGAARFWNKITFLEVPRLRPFYLLLNGSFENNDDDNYGVLV